MRIALAQTNIQWENKQKNLEKAVELATQAKKQNAEMIFFPEMSFTGFSMNTEYTAEEDNYTVEKIRNLSKEYGIAIGFGWVKRTQNKSQNHYTVMSEEGEVLSDYVKIHPFSYAGEEKVFESGQMVSSYIFKGFRLATLICYDLRFPELFQIASTESDVIIVAANWPQKRVSHWNSLLQARAIENQSYVLGVNCVGDIDNLHYSGNTSAYDYDGNLLGSIVENEGILFVDIDQTPDKAREIFPVKKDRKLNLYIEMYGRIT